MGIELMRVSVKEENDDFPPVPPGFEAYTSLTVKTVQDTEKQDDNQRAFSVASTSAPEADSVHKGTKVDPGNVEKIKRSLRRRTSVNYRQYDHCSDDEFGSERSDQNFSLRPLLPKGVIRGCAECSTCQKVTARWHPEESHRPDLEEAPIFYPTEEEFQDTLRYIASIRSRAEAYGICRIVPPLTWKPPCPLKGKTVWEASKFATRVQRIDKLQNRDSMRKASMVNNQMKKRRRCARMAGDCFAGGLRSAGPYEEERFGFEPGPEFTLALFQKYADDFKEQYFCRSYSSTSVSSDMAIPKENWEPSVENIEGEYWRMVEKPTEEIEVLYGADLETGVFGSGFPKGLNQVNGSTDEQYVKSGWNLNNFPRLPGSVLCYESSDISGVLVPWLYIGMCFSSFCWHVEDHHLYSLNYMHWGAPKIWYGVPGKDAVRLEEAMRKHLPDLFEEQPDLLHKLVTQLSPSILKSEGVPVYRCVQNSGEFILTFPRAYHSGFNCGFNCAEAVNVAPVDWLPHGQTAIELYREQGRKTSVSHDKLLLGAAREAVRAQWEFYLLRKNTSENLRWREVSGKDGTLSKALKMRIEMERVSRECISNSASVTKMESSFDATNEKECSFCFFDLHLSAVGCHCSPEKYVCLNHAKKLCSCAWASRIFLFRYDISELNVLADALEGKLSAVYRWARMDLGLSLSSYVAKDMSHIGARGIALKEPMSTLTNSGGDQQGMDFGRKAIKSSTGARCDISSQEKKSVENILPWNDAKVLSAFATIRDQTGTLYSPIKKELSHVTSSRESWDGQVSQKDSHAVNKVAVKKEAPEILVSGPSNVINLSDDEADVPNRSVLDEGKVSSVDKHVDIFKRMKDLDTKIRSCNRKEDAVLTAPVSDAAVMQHLPDPQASPIKDEHCGSDRPVPAISSLANATCHIESSTSQQCLSSQEAQTNPNNEDVLERTGTASTSKGLSGNLPCTQNNLDRGFRQKGPRIAKVVRRITCNVEVLDLGVVVPGKAWSNSQNIFPKGFKTRVRYTSVLDPTSTCYYISEILDAGKSRPLFMVYLEHCPSEVFIHFSAAICWEMVRDRVNQEIAKQHKLGKMNLPPLQPPGSLDGLEMFGFTSPAIVMAIEAMDPRRVSIEYWGSRPYSRPQVQIPQASQTIQSVGDINKVVPNTDEITTSNNTLPLAADTALRRLFQKANLEELNSLYSILSNMNKSTSDHSLLTRLLDEEMRDRLK